MSFARVLACVLLWLTPLAAGAAWPERSSAPYVDATLWPPLSLADYGAATGASHFVLGFLVDRTGSACEASWGAQQSLADGLLNDQVASLRASGGDILVSFGGAINTPLAAACASVDALKSELRRVVDYYDADALDFDIEGIWLDDSESIHRRSLAIAALQDELAAEGRSLAVWLTLPVLPQGLLSNGLDAVISARDAGVELAGVNLMVMSFGPANAPDPVGRMGAYAIQALESVHAQLADLYPHWDAQRRWAALGATPMIGVNDLSTEIFVLDDAVEVTAFSAERRLGRLSFWSATRDQACASGSGGPARFDCSGVEQQAGDFGIAFAAYHPPASTVAAVFSDDFG